ncbi:uncharacterized protein LOC134468856 isoform X2 [Engraulis encrasicolus]|uniref:uncharacterized protein LOC134468856 isoform X2 n=1 Tax=Engraulis encrasicolus TaxID=184585 RepID=UPI002FD0BD6F
MSKTVTGAFDQQGCPLVVFPAEAQNKLSDLTKEDIHGFISYFLRLHNESQEKESLVSVVVDLRHASLSTTRCICESLQQLELHKRTVHTLYAVQPKKKDALKLLQKVLVLGNSKRYISAPFKRVFLKEVFELYNHIDRSQLSPSLGGYLVYSHGSWVAFIKEIDVFVKEFLSVVQRLPSYIATLQTISQQTVPSDFDELQEFCSVNEARFQQLRCELGLDALLRHCEQVVGKLRYPESDPCYQAMAGTAIFTHTAYDMLLNYSRITSAVEKVELLWQQAFSKVHLQLRILQLQKDAQQITEQMGTLRKEKLQPYRLEVAKDARTANELKSKFDAFIYTPAMALVRRAEDVIHTVPEILCPLGEMQPREQWVEELEILKERFYATVQHPYQTLRAVADFHHYYDEAKTWYDLVLCENFLQDLLWGGNCEGFSTTRHHPQEPVCGVPVWRQAVYAFLRKNPSPEMSELVQLAHLATVVPEPMLQQSGKRLSHRCMTLRKLLTSPGAVALNDLQLALQWQYEFLRGSCQNTPVPDLSESKEPKEVTASSAPGAACGLPSEQPLGSSSLLLELTPPTIDSLRRWDSGKGVLHNQSTLLPPNSGTACAPASGKPPSLSSFDSGFDGAGSSHLENGNCNVNSNARETAPDGLLRLPVGPDQLRRRLLPPPRIHEENISSVSDSDEVDHQEIEIGGTSSASIQIIPKITFDSLNFEIKVKRSSTLPKNPWLSLPVEDLENSYTVTITPTKLSHSVDRRSPPASSERSSSSMSRDQPTQTEVMTNCSQPAVVKSRALFIEDSFDVSELSPVGGVLSSTITEPEESPSYVTEGLPTLLWDTYDFHLGQDACDGLSTSLSEVSLVDWAQREHEGLREVAEILDRAAGILEEEENILAQQEMLDALVQSESPNKQWPLWEPEEQFSVISSSELVECGVIGLEKDFVCLSSSLSSESETRVSPLQLAESQNRINPNLERVAQSSRKDLLKELQGLHDLEERILQENKKIHELRIQEVEELPQERSRTSSRSRTDREKFRKELEKEKREVEQMEQSLDKEMEKSRHKVKKSLSRSRRVLTRSMTERTARREQEKKPCQKPSLNSQEQKHHVEKLMGVADTGKVNPSADGSSEASLFPSDTIPPRNPPGDLVQSSGDRLEHSITFPGSNLPPEDCTKVPSSIGSTGSERADQGAPGCLMDELKAESCCDGSSKKVSVRTEEVDELAVVEAIENVDVCRHALEESGEGEASNVLDSTTSQNVDVNITDEVEGGQWEEGLSCPASLSQPGGGSTETTPVPKPRQSPSMEFSSVTAPEQDVIVDHPEKAPSSTPVDLSSTSTPPQPKARTSMRPVIHPDVIRLSSNNNNNNPVGEKAGVVSCIVDPPSCMEADGSNVSVQDPEVDFRNKHSHDLNGCEASDSCPLKSPVLEHHTTEHLNMPEVYEPTPVQSPVLASENKTTDYLGVCTMFEPTPFGNSVFGNHSNLPAHSDVFEPRPTEDPELEMSGKRDGDELDVRQISDACSESEHVEDMKTSNKVVEEGRNEDGSSHVFRSSALSVCPSRSSPVNQVREMSHFKVPVVLDTGSGLMKAGFADQDLPTTIFPTVIGVPKYEEVMNGSFERESYIGHDAQHMRGVLALRYPMKNGIIRNWDDMEMIWSHTFRQLSVEADEHPVLLTEAALNPKESRQRMVELMFEAFGVPLTYVAMQAVLALYAAGRTTGVVFDSGDGVSHSVPVFEGYCLSHAVQRFTLAGGDVTQHLRKLLQEQGVSMCTSAELEIVRDMKERHCYVALDYQAELARGGASGSPAYYTLPDGQALSLTTERFRAPEILFKPGLIGRDHYGMHESLFKSILHSDIDLRRSFVGNIVLSGGTTLLTGLPERLQRELQDMVPPDLAEAVRVTSPKDRDFSVWSGGAVLANLPAFSSTWIGQDEYEEFGPQIVFRKCF